MSDADQLIDDLSARAMAVGKNAWSPYSKFKVGAAVLDDHGSVHVGCNVESDSFGLTQCAERNALGAAIAAGVGKGEMNLMVIHVPGERALPPCGACRQVMVELMSEGARIVSSCDSSHALQWSREELLPNAFTMADTGVGGSSESSV